MRYSSSPQAQAKNAALGGLGFCYPLTIADADGLQGFRARAGFSVDCIYSLLRGRVVFLRLTTS